MDYGLIIITGVAVIAVMTAATLLRKALKRARIVRKGKAGERTVANELLRLGKKEYIVINDLLLESGGGKMSQIDHVVVSTRGIFVIETKSHVGIIRGYEYSQYWNQQAGDADYVFYNPLLQNASHMRTIRRVLPAVPDEMWISMIVFTCASRIDICADDIIIERSFLSDRHIRRTLQPERERKIKWWQIFSRGKRIIYDERKCVLHIDDMAREIQRRPIIMTRDEMIWAAEKLREAGVTGRGERRRHVEEAQHTARESEHDIRRGICPRCGGKLIRIEGEKGSYYGCTNYPRCRFTCGA